MKTVSILSYIGTLGAGIAIGVLCSRTYFEKRESERADREIKSMQESVRRIYKKEESTTEDPSHEESDKRGDDIPSYRAYYTGSAVDDILERRAEMEHPRDDGEKVKPYFIDIDDFDDATVGYAKKELSYYVDDGTLVDEEENILSIIDTVGGSNIESFENSLESSCYIRNESLKEDYEISKVFGSYGSIMGED